MAKTKRLACVNDCRYRRVDFKAGTTYEVPEEFVAGMLKFQMQIGPSTVRCFTEAKQKRKPPQKPDEAEKKAAAAKAAAEKEAAEKEAAEKAEAEEKAKAEEEAKAKAEAEEKAKAEAEAKAAAEKKAADEKAAADKAAADKTKGRGSAK